MTDQTSSNSRTPRTDDLAFWSDMVTERKRVVCAEDYEELELEAPKGDE